MLYVRDLWVVPLTKEKIMSFARRYAAGALVPLLFAATASAQAPQVEKNVSMKMALMIMEGLLEQCTKDGY